MRSSSSSRPQPQPLGLQQPTVRRAAPCSPPNPWDGGEDPPRSAPAGPCPPCCCTPPRSCPTPGGTACPAARSSSWRIRSRAPHICRSPSVCRAATWLGRGGPAGAEGSSGLGRDGARAELGARLMGAQGPAEGSGRAGRAEGKGSEAGVAAGSGGSRSTAPRPQARLQTPETAREARRPFAIRPSHNGSGSHASSPARCVRVGCVVCQLALRASIG